MALPGNDYRAHSDGYRSDKGAPDLERMMVELADEIEQEPSVAIAQDEMDMDGPHVVVEYETEQRAAEDAVRDVLDDWPCAIVDSGAVLVVRPE